MHAVTFLRRCLPFASAMSAALLMSGCANMVTTAGPALTSETPAVTFSGSLHGGDFPIINATVKIFSVGGTDTTATNYSTAGYGYSAGTTTSLSAYKLYATTTTGSNGVWSFSKSATNTGATTPSTPVYGCPATGNPQMYILATGGQTGGSSPVTNSGAAFILPLGPCQSISNSSFYILNEATTVATLAALQQYFDPTTDSLSTPSTTQATTAFASQVSLVSNMVDLAHGTTKPSFTTTATPTGATGPVTVTITPEQNKIDTIANIMAACVNTNGGTASGTACNTLFTDAVPPTSSAVTSQPGNPFPAATDTLMAVYYMLANPTSGSAANINGLYGLVAASAIYQPYYSTAPTDWTVGINYASTSACSTGTPATANFLAYVYHLAIDASGNVWGVSNSGTITSGAYVSGGNIFELSPTGTPSFCGLGTTVGPTTNLAIDTAGDIWTGGRATASEVYRLAAGGTTPTTFTLPTTYSSTGVQFLTIDGANNVFVTPYTLATGATAGQLYEFPSAATASAFTATSVSNALGTSPYFLAADTTGRIFSTNSSTTTTFYDVYPDTTTTDTNYLNGFNTVQVGSSTTTTNGYGVGSGLAGRVYTVNGNNAANTASNTLTVFAAGSAGTLGTATTTAQYAGGLVGPRELALDGAGNVWSVNSTAAGGNYVTAATTSGLYALTEFSASGAALSPTGTASSTSTVTGGFQKAAAVLPNAGRGIAVDPGGNVWVGSNSSTGTSVMELVGAAVPVVTPIASALAAGATSTNAVSKP